MMQDGYARRRCKKRIQEEDARRGCKKRMQEEEEEEKEKSWNREKSI